MNLFSELKRRNVIRVAIAYLIIAWLVAQVSDLVLEAISAPAWVMQTLLFVLALGFVVSVVISWAYELTEEGVKKERDVDRSESITHHTAKKLDIITIVAVVLLIGFFAWQQFNPTKPNQTIIAIQTVNTVDTQDNNTSKNLPVNEDPSQPDGTIPDKSIAVLPFLNRSSQDDDQFFADGIQDDLLTKLSKIHDMKVISRTSVMSYRNTTKKIPQIAQELGVANILEGGVQRSGTHIRINAQLIHAETDEHLWAETYDRELNADNVFAIQTEITIAIAEALKSTLTAEEKDQINKPLTDNLMAWEAYNKGFSTNSSNIEVFKEQIRMYKKAIELDPNFSAAYSQLAIAEMALFWWGENTTEQKQLAWKAIEKSRSIDANTAELFAAEAYYYYWGFRAYEQALDSVNKALAISPNSVDAIDVKGYILRRMGRFDESNQTLDFAASLNPKTTYAFQEKAETLVNLLQFEEAEKYIQRIEEILPNNKDIAIIKGQLLQAKDADTEAALIQFQRDYESSTASAYNYWWTLMAAGRMDQAIEFAQTNTQFASTGFSYSSNNHMTGLSYFLNGEPQKAVSYLTESVKLLEMKLLNNADDKNFLVALCQAYAALGNAEKADQNCNKALQINYDAYDYPLDVVSIIEAQAMLKQNQKALKTMEILLQSEIRPSEHTLRLDPFLKGLHDDPAFEPLIKRIGSGELVKPQ